MLRLRNEVCTHLIRGNEGVQLESVQFGTHIFTKKDMIGKLYRRLDSVDGLHRQDNERDISHVVFNNYNDCKNMNYTEFREFKINLNKDEIKNVPPAWKCYDNTTHESDLIKKHCTLRYHDYEDYFNYLTRFDYYDELVTLSSEGGEVNGRKFILFDEETLNLIGSYFHYMNRVKMNIYDEVITYEDFKHVKFMLLKNIDDMFRLINEVSIKIICYTNNDMTYKKLKNKLDFYIDDSYQEFFDKLQLNRYYDTAYFPTMHAINKRTRRIAITTVFITDLVKALLYSSFSKLKHTDLNNTSSHYTNLTCVRNRSHNAHLYIDDKVYYECRQCSDEDNNAISEYLSELCK